VFFYFQFNFIVLKKEQIVTVETFLENMEKHLKVNAYILALVTAVKSAVVN
jgi:hypothetical protein